jgi:RimJ/RimL family protein N-acetyltransferase
MSELFVLDFTKRLTIKLISEKDLEEARLLHNEPSVLSNLQNPDEVTVEMQLNWFKSLNNSQTSFRYVCRSKETSGLVGVFRVDNLDFNNRSVMIGLDISEKFRRQGFATEIYSFFIDYFFIRAKLNRIHFNTLESNIPARKLYEKLGFTIEGKQISAVMRYNNTFDLVCYYKLNNNPN